MAPRGDVLNGDDRRDDRAGAVADRRRVALDETMDAVAMAELDLLAAYDLAA
jgi:hypothetical protein